ncbi:MAG: ABC transporter permease [Acidobacteriota bacterium]|nr:ABC transporter permease [Acidobacteriota bacterium]
MRKIVAIALHDLRRTLADRGAVMWMFLLPLVFATFFGLVTGGGSSNPSDAQASLTVVDNDGGVVARDLLEDLAGQGVAITELSPGEREASEDLVRTLVIPAGFSEGVLAGEQQTLRLEKEPGTSEEAALVVQARIFTAITRLIGRTVEAAQGVESTDPVSSQAFTDVVVSDDLVSVESSFAGKATAHPDGFAQSIPGMAVMFVMLVALTYGAATISAERANGQLRRLITAPVTKTQIVAGKIGGRWIVAAAQITVFVLVGVIANKLFGVQVGDRPFQMWLLLLLYGLVVAPLGIAVGGWFKDPDRAANIGVMATMAMAAFGGCWWPIEIVSKPLKIVSLTIPSGWAMRGLHGMISFGRDLTDLGPELLALAAFGAVFSLLATRSIRVD